MIILIHSVRRLVSCQVDGRKRGSHYRVVDNSRRHLYPYNFETIVLHEVVLTWLNCKSYAE